MRARALCVCEGLRVRGSAREQPVRKRPGLCVGEDACEWLVRERVSMRERLVSVIAGSAVVPVPTWVTPDIVQQGRRDRMHSWQANEYAEPATSACHR